MIELILLEDEPALAQELAEFLEKSGYRVTAAGSLAAFTEGFDERRHHLAVIDLGLPDGDGLDLIHQLRSSGSTLGIVAFTARSTPDKRVTGFRQGVDHYLSKGCDLNELAAVLEALRRRLDLHALAAGHWATRTQGSQSPGAATFPSGFTGAALPDAQRRQYRLT
ncbi:response regulator transcription factor [Ectopseudomonas composti]|uniref:response regulator transcription factor n=1 Tax=Ectopseudomonas composti TaxID=658457 RepID=UPI0006877AC2|nr:response regulator transcription factor [Pseudomonas composti]